MVRDIYAPARLTSVYSIIKGEILVNPRHVPRKNRWKAALLLHFVLEFFEQLLNVFCSELVA